MAEQQKWSDEAVKELLARSGYEGMDKWSERLKAYHREIYSNLYEWVDRPDFKEIRYRVLCLALEDQGFASATLAKATIEALAERLPKESDWYKMVKSLDDLVFEVQLEVAERCLELVPRLDAMIPEVDPDEVLAALTERARSNRLLPAADADKD